MNRLIYKTNRQKYYSSKKFDDENNLINFRKNHVLSEGLDDAMNLQNKLNNPQFIDKAPKNNIEQIKIQSEEITSSIEKIDQIINNIK